MTQSRSIRAPALSLLASFFLAGLLTVASVGVANSSRACAADLVPVGAEWSYFKGTIDPDPDWLEVDFDDSGWLSGPTGIGYGDADDATVLSDMQNTYASVFCRHVFEVEDVGDLDRLTLSIDYDDGYVAYLNGVEVARAGLVGMPPPFNELASGHEAGVPTAIDLTDEIDFLEEGPNVLCVQVHNTSIGSSDLSMIPQLIANEVPCPTGLSCVFDANDASVTLGWTSPLVYESIEVSRDGEIVEPALAGDLTLWVDLVPPAGDLTYEIVAIDGDFRCPALSCTVKVFDEDDLLVRPGDEWRYFKGVVAPPADWAQPDFDDGDWLSGPTGIGYGDGDDATVLADMEDSYLTVFCRTLFVIDNPAAVDELLLSVTYDDGIVVSIDGEELARANVSLAVTVTNTTPATAAVEGFLEQVIPFDMLVEGENVIAVSVHNVNLTSSDLSFIPTLVLMTSDVGEPQFRRGDANGDGSVNVTDAVRVLGRLFQGQAALNCPDAGDVNDDGGINVTDPVFLLGSLFQGGAPPAPPGFNCGPDPTTDDSLAVCVDPSC